ncbi:Similar to Wasl: Neural Wiskott-Aldrich syndrome protein (Rattus norvegicus) [Cotesia congregata]|uniref:Similar to Wasl: Neural Wiskott-Aldrich syndrome protein (Rattus norvegicus) n=1 Tax=Cotesia congregata TaxID=51543 RepID=A0A8J2MGI7_COTCN|nr:Similar to Wasl: Neural Wiskott-Aldrich syndrome protein (Rattus norvegicus) [Cotesia congregata]
MKSTGAKEHRGCVLLKPEENEEIFRLIGNRCQCLAAGVIQLYLTELPDHREWIKKNTGIITLIRDNPKRSYFLRLYCPQRKAMLWEQELYNSMDYNAPLTYFHTFEGEECMVAFNFANETEAVIMRNIILERLNSNKQRRQERKTRIETDTQQKVVTLPRRSPNSSTNFFSSTTSVNMMNGSSSSVSVNGGLSGSAMYLRKKKRKKDHKRKLTVADISQPSNFRHVVHLGSDTSKCIDPESIDPTLRKFFDVAGVTKQQLTSRETRDFIYDFILGHGGITAVKNELGLTSTSVPTSADNNHHPLPPPPPTADNPPPIPARTVPVTSSPGINNNQSRTTRPLPPARTNVPPPPPSAPPAHRTLPSRPPPPAGSPALPPPPPAVPPPPPRSSSSISNVSNSSGSAPAPPPPPPPPPPLPELNADNSPASNFNSSSSSISGNNNGEFNDLRPKLMDAIRSGTTLKKVEQTEKKTTPVMDSRSDLLNQIRQGVELKPVVNEPKPASIGVAQGGLASALSAALAERSRLLGYTGDSQDSSSGTSDDDEWDD